MTVEKDRYTRITLRIPKDLHALLQEQADLTSKSMNAEIINAIQSHYRALEQAKWENSPEYWEGAMQPSQESPPKGLVGKELHKHIEEMKAQSQAELIAQKVTENLISNEDFLKALKKALSQK